MVAIRVLAVPRRGPWTTTVSDTIDGRSLAGRGSRGVGPAHLEVRSVRGGSSAPNARNIPIGGTPQTHRGEAAVAGRGSAQGVRALGVRNSLGATVRLVQVFVVLAPVQSRAVVAVTVPPVGVLGRVSTEIPPRGARVPGIPGTGPKAVPAQCTVRVVLEDVPDQIIAGTILRVVLRLVFVGTVPKGAVPVAGAGVLDVGAGPSRGGVALEEGTTGAVLRRVVTRGAGTGPRRQRDTTTRASPMKLGRKTSTRLHVRN